MTKIIFTPEYEAKLKKLGIKSEFMKEFTAYAKQYYDNSTLQEVADDLSENTTWYDFICAAFLWSLTKKGRSYWNGIANK